MLLGSGIGVCRERIISRKLAGERVVRTAMFDRSGGVALYRTPKLLKGVDQEGAWPGAGFNDPLPRMMRRRLGDTT
jgi:hypothetical protein